MTILNRLESNISLSEMASLKTIRVASYPPSLPGNPRDMSNPYVDLYYRALMPYKIDCIGEVEWNFKWLEKNKDYVDLIHIHWPESIWITHSVRTIRGLTRRRLLPQSHFFLTIETVAGIVNLRRFLRICKHLGIRTVWTVHNLERHTDDSLLDRIGRLVLARNIDLCIFHSEWARKQFLRKYTTKCKTVVTPHGNYQDVLPPPDPRTNTLHKLGLSTEKPVLGFIGGIRDSKGVNLVAEVFRMLHGEVQLIIAGRPNASYNASFLVNKFSGLSGHALLFRELTNQDISNLLHASDVILLPYRQITTSGALYAALSAGRGVVASKLPFFQEVLRDEPDAYELVYPGSASALSDGIKRFLAGNLEKRQAAARRLASKCNWNEIIVPIAREIRELVSPKLSNHMHI